MEFPIVPIPEVAPAKPVDTLENVVEGTPEKPAGVELAPAPASEAVMPAVETPPEPVVPSPAVEVARAPAVVRIPAMKDQVVEKIDGILVDKKMMKLWEAQTPAIQQKMKEEGETLEAELAKDISTGHYRPHKALKGVRKWLGIIPNVERSYQTQEASIKETELAKFVEERAHAGRDTM
ncbi:MAG: hypothetical protein WC802_01215 [Patescibacteria group bacterium]|jgi:hypothetical protein